MKVIAVLALSVSGQNLPTTNCAMIRLLYDGLATCP
jgi:hypothetical protein